MRSTRSVRQRSSGALADDRAARQRVERAHARVAEAVAGEQILAGVRDALGLAHHHGVAVARVTLEAERVTELVQRGAGQLGGR